MKKDLVYKLKKNLSLEKWKVQLAEQVEYMKMFSQMNKSRYDSLVFSSQQRFKNLHNYSLYLTFTISVLCALRWEPRAQFYPDSNHER